jgi:PAS domain S-box-containing protein
MGQDFESKRSQEELLKANRLYAVISQINHLVIHAKNKEEVYSKACQIAVEYGQLLMAWIGLINPTTNKLEPVVWAGHEDGYLSSIVPIMVEDVPEGGGPTGASIRQGHAVVLNSIDEPLFSLWREEAKKRGYASTVALPIHIDGKVIGSFSLYAATPSFFNARELSLLEEMSGNISFALESIEKAKISERRERDFKTIFEKSPVGIALIDSYDGQIYDLNEEYAMIAGRSMEEMRSTYWMAITHPDDIQKDLDNMAKMNEANTNGFKMHKRYIKPNGKIVWIHMSIVPFDINEHGRRRHLCIVEDITERKMIEEELYVALRMRDEFLMVASHELKTPLATLQLLLNSIRRTAEKDLPKDCCEMIIPKLIKAEKQSERLDLLIKSLLDVSQMRAQRFKIEPKLETDLSKLAKDLVEKLEADFNKDGPLLTSTITPGVKGEWDSLQLEQVLTNLISNAKKYGDGRPVKLIVEKIGENARVMVIDQGIGVPQDKQKSIFDRFERGVNEHSYKGLGLGLWIVRQIVEAHHGKVWVESNNGGSTFIVELPLVHFKRDQHE